MNFKLQRCKSRFQRQIFIKSFPDFRKRRSDFAWFSFVPVYNNPPVEHRTFKRSKTSTLFLAILQLSNFSRKNAYPRIRFVPSKRLLIRDRQRVKKKKKNTQPKRLTSRLIKNRSLVNEPQNTDRGAKIFRRTTTATTTTRQ